MRVIINLSKAAKVVITGIILGEVIRKVEKDKLPSKPSLMMQLTDLRKQILDLSIRNCDKNNEIMKLELEKERLERRIKELS